MPMELLWIWRNPSKSNRNSDLAPCLLPYAWWPETLPVPGKDSSAHLCFPSPDHSAFRTAPASRTTCPWRALWLSKRLRLRASGSPAGRVLAKLRGCSATPPEVTGAATEEPWTHSSPPWASEPGLRLRRKSRPSEPVGCPSRAGTGTRSEGWVRGGGTVARTAADAWPGSARSLGDPARPGAPILTQRGPHRGWAPTRCLHLRSGLASRCVGEGGLGLVCAARRPPCRWKVEGKGLPSRKIQKLIDRKSVCKDFGC